MRVMVLGGTAFVGRHLVFAAQAAGHEITLFNRGKSNPHLFPDVEKIVGDRTVDLSPLRGRTWDAVIDTSGYLPRAVKASVGALAGAHYTFISTLSVYRDWGPLVDESAPLAAIADPAIEEVNGETYGPLKALCEKAGPSLILRPGLIVGPFDATGRFSYWPKRVRKGGPILAPGRPQRHVQFIDARDLAEWAVRLIGQRVTGIFNVVTPPRALTMEQFLIECGGGDLRWVGDEILLRHSVVPYMEMPMWIPRVDDQFSCQRAIEAGITFRPLRRTLEDVMAWENAEPGVRKAGISPEREALIIKESSFPG